MTTATRAAATRTRQQERWRARYGPWAVVTGASDGIGREMARCLAAMGLNLVLVARRGTLLRHLADELAERDGIATLVIDADLARPGAVEAVIAATETLDVGLLVACAGFGTSGRLIDADPERELEMLAVNCRAVLLMSHQFGQRLTRRGSGGIVLMSSLLAFQGVPRSANYAATKAYIQSLAEGLHAELAPLGVDVVAAAPGPVQSGFGARAAMRMDLAAPPGIVARGTLRALGRAPTVRPGWLSTLLEGSLALLPRGARVRVMGRIMRAMTRHQGDGRATLA
jgi:uncharacterized protein